MPLHWRPVGPEPESTYWLRRAVLAAGALVLVVIAAMLLDGGDDAPDTLAGQAAPTASPTASPSAVPSPTVTPSPSPSPSATPTPSGSASPTPTPTPTAVTDCEPDDLSVEPAADQERYAVGSSPRLSLTVTNTGAAPCTVDLGQAAVELVVTSGGDRIWSSDDCAPGGEPDVVTLEPREPAVQRVTWNGLRSRPGCEGSKARAEAGTYRVSGRVGDLRADGDSLVLTS